MNDSRFPRGVYGQGDEPDTRFTLANERTFLAWLRTSLALLAGAVAVHAPAVDLDLWARTAFSLVLLVASALAISQAWIRWRRAEVAMRTGQPLTGFAGPAVLAGVLGVLVVGVAIGVVVAAF
ncbi:YidH family protein [Aeromicrobium sp. UC242_57]|uniref:YidH family protein n=1 Tax=Aeromicrobium sp. UC242_57 TaxID=3374624 RepID=UPI00378BEE35